MGTNLLLRLGLRVSSDRLTLFGWVRGVVLRMVCGWRAGGYRSLVCGCGDRWASDGSVVSEWVAHRSANLCEQCGVQAAKEKQPG